MGEKTRKLLVNHPKHIKFFSPGRDGRDSLFNFCSGISDWGLFKFTLAS